MRRAALLLVPSVPLHPRRGLLGPPGPVCNTLTQPVLLQFSFRTHAGRAHKRTAGRRRLVLAAGVCRPLPRSSSSSSFVPARRRQVNAAGPASPASPASVLSGPGPRLALPRPEDTPSNYCQAIHVGFWVFLCPLCKQPEYIVYEKSNCVWSIHGNGWGYSGVKLVIDGFSGCLLSMMVMISV